MKKVEKILVPIVKKVVEIPKCSGCKRLVTTYSTLTEEEVKKKKKENVWLSCRKEGAICLRRHIFLGGNRQSETEKRNGRK